LHALADAHQKRMTRTPPEFGNPAAPNLSRSAAFSWMRLQLWDFQS
jgi:hypothetical protein